MEDKTFLAASGELLSADICSEPSIKTEPASVLEEEVDKVNQTAFTCEEDSNHSNGLAGDAPAHMMVMRKDGRVLCPLCKRVYKNKGSLATHLRAKHKLCGNARAKMPCLEVGCDYRANRIARLITHLIQEHKMKFQCEKVTFQKKDDFWKWRKEAEERCRSSYCAETSAKTMVSGDIKFFLRCRRSGYTKCHSKESKMQGTRKGSVKINAVCTSFMEVTFSRDGGATVHFCRTHYGHADDGQHLRMNNEERESIRQLILEGQSASAIIATMKTKMPQHRHHLLKYSNIRNISMRQNLLMTRGRDPAGGCQRVFPEVVMGETGQDSLTLQVEKEVEVEAGDGEMSPNTVVLESHPQASRGLGHIQDCSLERVQKEVKTKIERVACLAASVTSEATLKYLSENLDFMTDLLESQVNIEVIPESAEPTEDSGQNVVLHKDIDGNTHLLLCSTKSIDDLVCKKE